MFTTCNSSLISGDWFGVNPQPIIIRTDNEIYPNNNNDFITYNEVGSSRNRLVLSDFTLPITAADFTVGETYKLTSNNLLYTVVEINTSLNLVYFDSALPSGLPLTGTMKRENKRYNNVFEINAGLPITHNYYGLNPYTRLGSISVIPNVLNESYLDVSPLLRGNFKYDDDWTNKPSYNNFFNDVDLWNEVNITVKEKYEIVDGDIVTGDELNLDPFYVINGSIKPTEGNYTKYLIKPINEYPLGNDGIKQQFLSIYDSLYYFKNRPFTINFLLTKPQSLFLGGIQLLIEVTDQYTTTQIVEEIPEEVGYGYIRYIFDIDRLYAISGEVIDTTTIKYFTVQLRQNIYSSLTILSEKKKGYLLNSSFNDASNLNATKNTNCSSNTSIDDAITNQNVNFKNIFISFLSPLGTWEYMNFDAITDKIIEVEEGSTLRNNLYRNNKPYQNQQITKKIIKRSVIRTTPLDKSFAYNLLNNLITSVRVFKYNDLFTCEKELILLEAGDVTISGKDKNFSIEINYTESVESLTQSI